MADTCLVLRENLEHRKDTRCFKTPAHHRLQAATWPPIPEWKSTQVCTRERERECHGVEQYIRLFSSFRRIPIILLDNIILCNSCFWILAKQISCRIVWCMVVTFVKLGQHLTVGFNQQSLKFSCTNNIIISCWKNPARVKLSSTHQCTHYPKDEWTVDRQHFVVIFQSRSEPWRIAKYTKPSTCIYLPIEALPTYVPTKYTKTP